MEINNGIVKGNLTVHNNLTVNGEIILKDQIIHNIILKKNIYITFSSGVGTYPSSGTDANITKDSICLLYSVGNSVAGGIGSYMLNIIDGKITVSGPATTYTGQQQFDLVIIN